MMLAAVAPETILVGIAGPAAGVVAAVLTARATRRTARAAEGAAVFEGYDELVANLRLERDRAVTRMQEEGERQRAEFTREREHFVERIDAATAELSKCEGRCQECREEIGALLSDLAGLRAIVADEVAREAAGAVIAAAAERGEIKVDEPDTAAIRRMLRDLPKKEKRP